MDKKSDIAEVNESTPKPKIPQYTKILKEIELEAEKILPNKKLKTFFKNLYEPLDTTE